MWMTLLCRLSQVAMILFCMATSSKGQSTLLEGVQCVIQDPQCSCNEVQRKPGSQTLSKLDVQVINYTEEENGNTSVKFNFSRPLRMMKYCLIVRVTRYCCDKSMVADVKPVLLNCGQPIIRQTIFSISYNRSLLDRDECPSLQVELVHLRNEELNCIVNLASPCDSCRNNTMTEKGNSKTNENNNSGTLPIDGNTAPIAAASIIGVIVLIGLVVWIKFRIYKNPEELAEKVSLEDLGSAHSNGDHNDEPW